MLRELAGWLAGRAVEVVVLEATGDYWRPVFYPLQDAGLNLMPVNPAHLKGVRGRKTDPSDAAFLAGPGPVTPSCPAGRPARRRPFSRNDFGAGLTNGESDDGGFEEFFEFDLNRASSSTTRASSRAILSA